ncbi:MAG: hypothetical protein HW403_872 [Dehalococcoidia bacterium]|nr:hypothetical protein [Dehalococcoidia bacterium]
MAKDPFVLNLANIRKQDIPLAGGKGANLGELISIGIPVPPGFVVTSNAYAYFLERSNLGDTIRKLLNNLDPNGSEKLQMEASKIKSIITQEAIPDEIAQQIIEAYRAIGSPLVAVRSSATAEDLPDASFAGQQSTFLNIQGEKDVLQAVKACWASLFEARAIFYRAHQGYDHLSVGIAVPVQKMVQSEISGVMFTCEPVTSDPTKVVVEAIYGLGEAIVSGAVTPDMYVIDKATRTFLDRNISVQEWKLVRNLESTEPLEANMEVNLSPEEASRQKLTDDQILELVEIGLGIERHYGTPQDIEWARENSTFYVVQTRPVTTLAQDAAKTVSGHEITGKLLLSGSPASPGADYGPVKIIFNASQIGDVVEGDVLVTMMTTPDFVPAMKRAASIVTERGGRTAHAAIVSRELGIPCVVGVEGATRVLRPKQMVTVDGTWGKIFEGILVPKRDRSAPVETGPKIATRTTLYVNLAEPELADIVSARNVDGVGLLRAEFIVARIGEHPRYAIKTGRSEEFIEKLADGLTKFASAFNVPKEPGGKPRPVVYRTTDFKTNEYRDLKGGAEFEGEEENPMLGYRGASRYVGDIDVFKLEIEAIKRVRRKYKNLWVMIPFVRTPNEMAQTKKILAQNGLRRSENFKLWMMVEVPSNIFLLDKFLDVGIDGVSIGSNDLTQLILGIDRDNAKLADTFDERNEAVMMAIEHVITTCRERGVTVSICGQAPSVFPELTRKLVEWGINSISVSPDMITETRKIIADAEKRVARSQRREKAASNASKSM